MKRLFSIALLVAALASGMLGAARLYGGEPGHAPPEHPFNPPSFPGEPVSNPQAPCVGGTYHKYAGWICPEDDLALW